MSWKSLHPHSKIQQAMNLLRLIIKSLQLFGAIQSLLNGYTKLCRNQLGDFIYITKGHIKSSAHILDSPLGRQGSKGNNLSHMILTVAAFYILNDLFAAHITKVHVYIRHGYALRVEEALKEQGIFKWVNIRNTKQVGHNTACRRASTRTNGNILAASIIYKIPYNKEIAIKAHSMNNPKLVLQTITDFLGFLRIMG